MLSSILGAEQRISEPPKMAHPYEIQNTFEAYLCLRMKVLYHLYIIISYYS